MLVVKAIAGLGALALAGLSVQTAQDPNRPTPRFDTKPPTLPPLKRPAVLIFSKTNGWRHDSIPDAVAAIEKLVMTRAWRSYATANAAIFNPEQLAQFDLIIFASATGDMFTPEQKAAFEGWIASGRGFVGLHGAGDNSHPGWYQAMLGYSDYAGHPGGADQFQTGELIVEDRKHPATRHLPPRWRWTEEYYAYASPLAADAHVLARLDETGMRFEPKQQMGDRHSLIWWRCEGRTRIFYSALGHRPEAWSDATHLKLVDGAMRWAMRRDGAGCDGK